MTKEVTTIIEEVNDIVKTLADKHQELVEKLKPDFHKIFTPLFDKYEDVYALQFTAYTPYFNDGEPCTFSVGGLGLVRKVDLNEDGEYENEDGNYVEEYSGYGKYYGSLTDVLNYKINGVLLDSSSTAYGIFERQVSYESWDYSHRPAVRVTKQGFQTFKEWFEDQHKSALSREINELRAEAEFDADFDAVADVFGSLPDEIIESLFGDHIKVTITRDGVNVEEYDHD